MTAPARGPRSRSLRRLWLRLRYRTVFTRYRRLVIERVDGVPLIVLPEVFNPVLFRSGVLLARSIQPASSVDDRRPGVRRALDMGTGSGIGAIFAARRGYGVIAVDVNSEAIRCARLNVLLNNLEENIELRPGDLFAPIAGERFDLVLFNPPFYRGAPVDRLDQAWRGTDVIERFASGLSSALAPGGQALIVLSTDGEWEAMLAALNGRGFQTQPVVTRDFGNEILTVYSARSDPRASLA